MRQSLYDKYGGFSTVNKIVQLFYQKVLESEELGPYFEKVDMQHLMNHQTNFLSSVLGGPVQYTGRQLEAVHRNLKVTDSAFSEVADLMEEALEDCGVSEEDTETILNIITETKTQIVTA